MLHLDKYLINLLYLHSIYFIYLIKNKESKKHLILHCFTLDLLKVEM